ncbi:MAG: hypothetical protein CSA29_06025 [Desulfobacterales bacterium]|nr:MAG: hypothetical protein CSA29_06025 [Desulfobacterales bacterium]
MINAPRATLTDFAGGPPASLPQRLLALNWPPKGRKSAIYFSSCEYIILGKECKEFLSIIQLHLHFRNSNMQTIELYFNKLLLKQQALYSLNSFK